MATVAPPSGGGGVLCLKDMTKSETGILQAPTLHRPVKNIKGTLKMKLVTYVQMHWSSRLGLIDTMKPK